MADSFTPGSTFELVVNANCIPAGRYRFMEERDDVLFFSVGSEVQLGLRSSFWRPFFRPVPGLCPARTQLSDFIQSYVELYVDRTMFGFNPNPEALTMCMTSLRVHKRMLKLAKKITIRRIKAEILVGSDDGLVTPANLMTQPELSARHAVIS